MFCQSATKAGTNEKFRDSSDVNRKPIIHSIPIKAYNVEKLDAEEPHTVSMQILQTVRKILEEVKLPKSSCGNDFVAEQWLKIATLFDRMLFVAFMVVIISISIWFLTSN